MQTGSQYGFVKLNVMGNYESSMTCPVPWSSDQLFNLHSLAKANLISHTEQEIAKQLLVHKTEKVIENTRKDKVIRKPEFSSAHRISRKIKHTNGLFCFLPMF